MGGEILMVSATAMEEAFERAEIERKEREKNAKREMRYRKLIGLNKL